MTAQRGLGDGEGDGDDSAISIGRIAAAFRRGEATPLAVAERVLDAVAVSERGDSPLRAFVAQDRGDVLAQARAATARHASGTPLSVLDGVPIAVKDELDQVPYHTKAGTAFLGARPAVTDATVVQRLRAAGAVLIGKANMAEIGINPTGFNPHHGIARNPWNLGHDPGGSSSGSAVAVAAGLCPAAIGADGGGSIRIPASLCGIVGLKATFGRIPEHGVAPLCWSVGHVGPLACCAADAAILYGVIAGPDGGDPNSLRQPRPTLEGIDKADLAGLRLGVYSAWFDHCDPEVAAVCHGQVAQLQDLGALVVEVEIAELEEMRIAHAISILSEMAASLGQFREHWDTFAPATRINLEIGAAFGAADFVHAQRMRRRAVEIFRSVFEQVDAIVSPATAVPSPPIPPGGAACGWSDLATVTELMRYCFAGNLTGLPAISFPAGFSAGGLPIGMQAMGRPWEEHLLLRIARAAEKTSERRRPPVCFDLLAR